MNLLKTIFLVLPLFYCCTKAQPAILVGEVPMTPISNLQLFPQKVQIPDKFKGMAGVSDMTVNLPEGWTASLYYANTSLLKKPRFMAWSPDSVLHISDISSGRILALRDINNDGAADTAVTVASNIFANSIEFYNGALYAAQEFDVLKLTDENGDGIYEKTTVFIKDIPGNGGHYTRTITFDKANKKMYLSIGSSCNICRENNRSIIEEYNDDGTGKRTYATGVRNAVGMTIHPVTGKLWANNNGSDLQGENIPPEWIDIVRENGFYGFPIAYHHQNYFNFAIGGYNSLLPITAADSTRVRSMKLPGALVQAHSAPMQMQFSNNSFPTDFQNGAFVVLRGAWNTSQPNGSKPGYKVVYLRFDSPTDTIASSVTDLITGFQTAGGVWARPVGLAIDQKGNIYLGSDDLTKFIIKITPQKQTGINEENSFKSGSFTLSPNPASGNILLKLPDSGFTNAAVEIFNILGEKIRQFTVNSAKTGNTFSTEGMTPGVYFCQVRYGTVTETKQFQIIR
ncbi:MAG: T9SS type A sorting domain-containing protein [Bacteroidota bacterium]